MGHTGTGGTELNGGAYSSVACLFSVLTVLPREDGQLVLPTGSTIDGQSFLPTLLQVHEAEKSERAGVVAQWLLTIHRC